MFISMKMALIGGVAILAVAGITVGIVFATMGDDCTEYSAPVDLKFTKRSEKLFLVWGSPDGMGEDCTPKYKLKLTVNDGEPKTINIDNQNEYEIEDPIICTTLKATLTAVDENDDESEAASDDYVVDVGDVTDVTVENVQHEESETGYSISWEKPTDYALCTFVYTITVNNEQFGEPIETDSVEIPGDKFHVCSNEVVIQPKIQEQDAKSESIIIEEDVDDVSELKIPSDITSELKDGIYTLNWEKPTGFDQCEIKYSLYLEDALLGEPFGGETTTIANSILKRCVQNKISIEPKIQDKPGERKDTSIKGDETDVSDLKIPTDITKELQDGIWTLNWEKPTDYEGCELTYLIKVGDTPLDNEAITTTAEIPNDTLEPCVANIVTVTPKLNDKEGEEKTVEIIGELSDVSELKIPNDITHTLNGDNFVLTWEKPTAYPDCSITYLVSLGDEVLQDDLDTETVEVPNEKLARCVDNSIFVTPKIGTLAGEMKEVKIEGVVTDISDLKIPSDIGKKYEDGSWILTWSKPTGYETCSITYSIKVGETTLDGEPTTETITIPNASLTPCVDTTITVTPKYNDQPGEGKDVVITGELSDVSELKIPNDITHTLNGDNFVLTWEKPTAYPDCSITYLVSLGDEQLQDNLDTETVEVPNEKLARCVDNSIFVTPKIGTLAGEMKEVKIEGVVTDISDLKIPSDIGKKYEDGNWILTWSKPTGYETCSITYSVKMGETTLDDEPTTETITIPNASLTPCVDTTITVTPKYNDQPGEGKDVVITGELSDVSELKIPNDITHTLNGDNFVLTWEKPTAYPDCSITYLVSLGDEQLQDNLDTETVEVPNEKLARCVDNSIFVTPKIGTLAGEMKEVKIEGVVTDISDLKIPSDIGKKYEDGSWILTWSKPTGYETCSITYSVKMGETTLDDEPTTETITIPNASLTPCVDTTITVTPKYNDQPGEGKDVVITGELSDVSELKIPNDITHTLNGDNFVLTWEKPTAYPDCSITYLVSLGDEQLQDNLDTETVEVPNEKLARCVDNSIFVTPKIGTLAGEMKEVKIEGVVTDISDLKIPSDIGKKYEDGSWILTWSKPTGYETCSLTYSVKVGETTLDDESTTETVAIENASLTPCVDTTITVTPKYNDQPGEGKDVVITGDLSDVSELKIPNDITHTLNGDNFVLTWEKPTAYPDCSITYLVSLGDEVLQDNLDTETVEVPNGELAKCVDNSIFVTPKVGTLAGERKEVKIEGVVTDISDLKISSDIELTYEEGNWILTWSKPTGYETCSLTYSVKVGETTLDDESTTETVAIENASLTPCVDTTITVTPKYNDQPGEGKDVVITGEPAPGDRVSDVVVEMQPENKVKVTWKKNEAYNQCNFTYKIVLKNGDQEMGSVEGHTSESWDTDNTEEAVCSEITAVVQAKLEIYGAEQSGSCTDPETH